MESTYSPSENKDVWFSFKPSDIEIALRNEIEAKKKRGEIEYRNTKGEIKPLHEMPDINNFNITRTVRAWLYGSDLKRDEDYYFTGNISTTYHVKVNQRTLSILKIFPMT